MNRPASRLSSYRPLPAHSIGMSRPSWAPASVLAAVFFILIASGQGQTLTDSFPGTSILTNYVVYHATGNSSAATSETGEPDHAGAPALRSMWIRVRMPFDAHCLFTVEASVASGARLALYTGDALTSLVPTAALVSDSTNRTLSVVLSSNTTYCVAMDSRGSTGGSLRLGVDLRQIYFGRPAEGSVFVAPARIELEGVWTPQSMPLRQLDFYNIAQLTTRIGTRTNAPWTMAVTNAAGEYQYRLQATPMTGAGVSSQILKLRVAPANDRFEDATVIPGATTVASMNGTTAGSVAEPGEPKHISNSAASHSVWWTWTPAYDRSVSITVVPSSGLPLTLLAVYAGSNVTNLTMVTNTSRARAVAFNPQPGTRYSIALETGPTASGTVSWSLSQPTLSILPVDAATPVTVGRETRFNLPGLAPEHPLAQVEWLANGVPLVTHSSAPFDLIWTPTEPGPVVLTVLGTDELGTNRFSLPCGLTVRPVNDAFADAIPLPADPGLTVLTVTNRAASLEPGEPAHAGGANSGSLWYTWTPVGPGVARLTIPVELSGAVRMAAYKGDILSNLTLVANNILPTGGLTNQLLFRITPGTSYRIALDGATAAGPLSAEFERHTLVFLNPPLGNDLDWGRTNRFELASLDPDFTPAGGEWRIDNQTVGEFAQTPALWDWLADRGGLHTFTAQATNAAGEIRSTAPFIAYVGPANDDFARAEVIDVPAGPWEISGDTAFATWEPGEIETSGWPDTGSVWFRWLPPRSRQYTLHFTGPEGTEMDGFAGDSVAGAMPIFRGGSVDSTPSAYLAGGVPTYFRVFRRWQSGGAGPFRIELYASPVNDDFADSIPIPPGTGSFVGINRSASLEANEPFFGCLGTLWWHWTAPADGEITLGADASDCNVIGAAFRGDAVDRLTAVGEPATLLAISGSTGWKYPAYLVVRVRRGVTYHFALGTGSGVEGPTSGTLHGSLAFRAIPNLPPNDDFADRTRLSAASITAAGNTTEATREPGEPQETAQRTLWWEWTPPADGVVQVWLESPSFMPVLMLYQVQEGWGFVEAYPRLDRLNFTGISGPFVLPVHAGQPLQISAGEPVWTGGPGPVTLRIETYPLAPPPANDAFLNAIPLTGSDLTIPFDLFGSTFEPGEPSPTDGLPPIATYSGSLWWRFVPPANGRLTLQSPNPTGAAPPIVGLYQGTALASLQLLTHAFGGPIVSTVQGGEEYRIAVAGPSLGPATFQLRLQLSDLVPTNNAFAGSIHLEGTNLVVGGTLFGCNRESGEPNHGFYPDESLSGESAWWSWVAPFTGKAVVVYPDGTDNFRLAIYTGPAVDRLTPVNASRQWDHAIFAAKQDTVYHFGIERTSAGSGWVNFTLDESRFPDTSPNDNFADAFILRGLSDGAAAANLAATREPGEPAHRAGGPNKSLWWRWVMPNTGEASISNWEGALREATVAVYTGAGIDTLALVAKGTNSIRFAGTGGQTYHIAAETPADVNGDMDLRVSGSWPDGTQTAIPGNLVQNPSFEELVDALPIARWNNPNGFIGVVGATGAEGAADGRNYLILSGNTIWQDLVTVPGQPYHVRLAVLGTDQEGPARIKVRFGDRTLPEITFESNFTQRYWHWFEFDATTPTTATRLEIASTGVRVGVDAVSVVWPNQPPRIVTPPEGRSAFVGTGVSFHAGVEGAAPLVLHWEFNGQPLAGATGPTLFLPAVTPAQAGTYALVATNSFGAVTSAPVHLNVEQPSSPTLVLQPQGQTAAVGEYVALVVGAVGTPPLGYQWFKNGEPIAGATHQHLVFSSYQSDNAGEYHVVVANAAESVASLPASLHTGPAVAGGGQVRFANWWPDPEYPIKAWVCDTDGLTRLAGDAFRAQIYAGATAESLRPAGDPQPFLTGFGAGIWAPTVVTLPHIAPGTDCVVQVRVWDAAAGASYEEARAFGGRFGRSESLRLTPGGSGPNDLPPTPLTGLRSFSLRAGQPEFVTGELTLVGRDPNGTIHFRLRGQPGFWYLVEKRGDTADWRPFLTLDNATGSVEFSDTTVPSISAPAAFYRGRILD